MLQTFDGAIATNPFLTPQTSHIELYHPSIVDRLILCEHTERPYESYQIGQTTSNGRSLMGAIKLQGSNWKRQQWECNFLANAAQVTLFGSILQAQQDDTLTSRLIDRWQDVARPVINVWIDIDRQYLTISGGNNWFRLQFTLLEV